MRLASAWTLPANPHAWAGDLLLDPDADSDAVLAKLVQAIRAIREPILCLDGVTPDAPHWRKFRTALDAAGQSYVRRALFRVGQVSINRDWQACRANWSREPPPQTRANR